MVSIERAGWTFGLASTLGVPDYVALVYEFVNSVDHRSFSYQGYRNLGGDEFASMGGLRSWLGVRGLLADADPISATDLGTARSVRAGLRDAIATRASLDPAASTLGEFTVLAPRVPLDLAIDPHGWPRLRPRPCGVRGGLGLVLIEAVTASATRRWKRLKMCGAPDCRWVFFDASRPGTARWCETEICGNRMKKTNQRARRRASTTVPG